MEKASDRQEGGNHYKDMPIQPAEFCQRNRLNWCEANVVKYVCRHAEKKGAEDIRKAIHYLQLLLEWEYPFVTPDRYAEIHTPLSPEEVERIAGEVVPASLCESCSRRGNFCPLDSPNMVKECGQYTSNLREQMAEAKETKALCPSCAKDCIRFVDQTSCSEYTPKESQALDLSLPSIVLECTAEEAYAKYLEECREVEKAGTVLHSLIELWDCIQAVQTSIEKGGAHQRLYAGLISDMIERERHGNQVALARRAMLVKNAARWRYHDHVNRIIIESNGHRWK